MANLVWYYNAGNGVYYWTESYSMSVTQFALKVSQELGKTITASDTSAATKKINVDAMKARASTLIHL